VKVSVVIPTYNRASLVRQSIQSALNQTYKDLEVLVVDDGSTDETYEAVKMYFEHPEVRYLRHEQNKGHQAARNTGIKNARGEYIAFLDSDDTWIPQKIDLQLSALGTKKAKCISLTGMWIVDTDGRKTKYLKRYNGYVYHQMLAGPGPNLGCMLAPIECLRQIGFLDESINAWIDWDTCITLSKLYEFVTVDEPCMFYHPTRTDSVTKNTVGGFPYQHIIEKNQNDMLRFIGKRGLARHYRQVAWSFYEAGEFKLYRAGALQAFAIYNKSPKTFLLAFSTLLGERVYRFTRSVSLVAHLRALHFLTG
jgi:glycosyltransferase involved in cell wall biosynthesis